MNQLIKNSVFNIIGWVINILIGIITVPIFINKLNPELYGVLVLLLSLLGYYGLMDLGLGQAVIKFVAEYEAKKDFSSIYKYIFTATFFNIILGIIGTFVLIYFSENLLILLNVPSKYIPMSLIAVRVFSVGFFFSLLSTTFSSVFQGFQQYKITTLINMIINILIYLVSILGLYYGGGLIFLSIVFSFSYFLSFFIYFILLLTKHPTILKKIEFNYNALKKLFSFSVFYFMSKILNTFSNYFIQFLISFILNPLAVTYYSVPRKLVTSFSAFVGSGSAVLFPKVSELSSRNKNEEIIKLYYQSCKLISILSFPIFFMFLLFSKEILTIWIGNELAKKTYIIMSLMSLQTLIGVLTIVPNNYLLGLGETKIQGYFSLITTISLVIFMPLLTYFLHVEGTILSLIISSIPGIILINYLNKSLLGINNISYWKNILSFNLIFYLLAIIIIIISINVKEYMIVLILKLLLTISYIFIIIKNNLSIIINSLKKIKFELSGVHL